jgi:hypothetical protein
VLGAPAKRPADRRRVARAPGRARASRRRRCRSDRDVLAPGVTPLVSPEIAGADWQPLCFTARRCHCAARQAMPGHRHAAVE